MSQSLQFLRHSCPPIAILSVLWLSAIAAVAFLWNLGGIGLVDETEPLFAEAARQMLVTDNWITPYFNGETRFDKPPLIYWLMAIAYRFVGVNEWGVRLPSALAAIALMACGFYTLHQVATLKKSRLQSLPWIGSALIALNPATITWGRIGVSDMLLTACVGSALFAFFLGYIRGDKNPRRFNSWYLTFYLLTALAVLTKGPIGVVLPALIIGSFSLYVGTFRELGREMRPLFGGTLFFLITLPWYILVTLENGQSYLNSFFGYHNFERFTQVVNHHAAPWYFYFIVVAIGFVPWSIYLPAAIAHTNFWNRRYWRQQERANQLGLFAFFWLICIFLFFTIAVTKLPSYVLPLMPAGAILVALFWSHVIDSETIFKQCQSKQSNYPRSPIIRFFLPFFVFNIIGLLAISFAFLYGINWLGVDVTMPNLPEKLGESGLLVRAALIWAGTAAAIAIGGFAIALFRHHISWIFTINLIGFVAFLIVAVTPGFIFFDQQRQYPLRALAATVRERRQPGEELVMIGFEKPSLVFYTRNPVKYRDRATEAVADLRQPEFQSSPPETVLILAIPREFDDAGLRDNNYQLLNKVGAYQLARVSKPTFLVVSPRIEPD
ncbi:MAG: ArnT family glycosyltransferase [Limnospira sp.]